ncbi:MAG: methyltransferase [Elainellaceae cyanobacterium]
MLAYTDCGVPAAALLALCPLPVTRIEYYKVKFETICIGGISYTIRSLLDLQQFSDSEGKALRLGISSAMWPLFGQVWPMGKILAQVMAQENLDGRRVLEVGCGLALPSIVVKRLGGDITASDYHPLAQAFLLENTILNALSPIPFSPGNWDVEDTALGKFDLIVGSDILYERRHVEQTSLFIDQHCDRSGEVIVVDPGRGSHRAFARAMEGLGYSHSWTDLGDYPCEGVRPKGFILRFAHER